jgi:hypothetical protein
MSPDLAVPPPGVVRVSHGLTWLHPAMTDLAMA